MPSGSLLMAKNTADSKFKILQTDGNGALKTTNDVAMGQPNNIGDANNMLRILNYGYDSINNQMRPIPCDANGRMECSVDALEITADTINVSTDNLETLIGATNTKLDGFSGAPDNNLAVTSTKLQVFPYGKDSAGNIMRPIKVDSIGKVIIDTPTGSDIDVRLAAIKTSVDTANLNDDVGTILFNNVTLSTGAVNTTTIDMGANSPYKQGITFFGKCNMDSASDNFGVYYSIDNTNYYKKGGIRPAIENIDSMYHFGSHVDAKVPRYIRFGNDCGTNLTNFTLVFVKHK
tara:strand:- start:221 stop:1090 length:870 start_codon:yes stop_codon:yes gene_type:complete